MAKKNRELTNFFLLWKNVVELMKKKKSTENIPQHNTEQSILVVFRNHPKRN